jgi:hypothetical protein
VFTSLWLFFSFVENSPFEITRCLIFKSWMELHVLRHDSFFRYLIDERFIVFKFFVPIFKCDLHWCCCHHEAFMIYNGIFFFPSLKVVKNSTTFDFFYFRRAWWFLKVCLKASCDFCSFFPFSSSLSQLFWKFLCYDRVIIFLSLLASCCHYVKTWNHDYEFL